MMSGESTLLTELCNKSFPPSASIKAAVWNPLRDLICIWEQTEEKGQGKGLSRQAFRIMVYRVPFDTENHGESGNSSKIQTLAMAWGQVRKAKGKTPAPSSALHIQISSSVGAPDQPDEIIWNPNGRSLLIAYASGLVTHHDIEDGDNAKGLAGREIARLNLPGGKVTPSNNVSSPKFILHLAWTSQKIQMIDQLDLVSQLPVIRELETSRPSKIRKTQHGIFAESEISILLVWDANGFIHICVNGLICIRSISLPSPFPVKILTSSFDFHFSRLMWVSEVTAGGVTYVHSLKLVIPEHQIRQAFLKAELIQLNRRLVEDMEQLSQDMSAAVHIAEISSGKKGESSPEKEWQLEIIHRLATGGPNLVDMPSQTDKSPAQLRNFLSNQLLVYSNILKNIQLAISPTVEVILVHLVKLSGLVSWSEKSSAGPFINTFSNIKETINECKKILVLADTMGTMLQKEMVEFQEFINWLIYVTEKLKDEPNIPIDYTHHHPRIFRYFQSIISTNDNPVYVLSCCCLLLESEIKRYQKSPIFSSSADGSLSYSNAHNSGLDLKQIAVSGIGDDCIKDGQVISVLPSKGSRVDLAMIERGGGDGQFRLVRVGWNENDGKWKTFVSASTFPGIMTIQPVAEQPMMRIEIAQVARFADALLLLYEPTGCVEGGECRVYVAKGDGSSGILPSICDPSMFEDAAFTSFWSDSNLLDHHHLSLLSTGPSATMTTRTLLVHEPRQLLAILQLPPSSSSLLANAPPDTSITGPSQSAALSIYDAADLD